MFELSLTILFICLGAVIVLSSLEYLFIFDYLKGTQLLGWRIGRHCKNELTLLVHPKYLDPFMNEELIFWMLIVRIFFGLLIVFYQGLSLLILSLSFLLFSTLILSFRNPFGKEGSDHLVVITLAALLPLSIFPEDNFIRSVGVGFLFLQVCLAYTTSGASKLVSPLWLSGNALKEIMASGFFGREWLHSLLKKYKFLSVALTMPLITWQVLFPILLLLNNEMMLAALMTGILFHLSVALIMGISRFPLIFIGTYPLLAYSATTLREHIALLR